MHVGLALDGHADGLVQHQGGVEVEVGLGGLADGAEFLGDVDDG